MTVQKAIEILEWWQEAFKEAGHQETSADMNMILKEFREISPPVEEAYKLSPEEVQRFRECAELMPQVLGISSFGYGEDGTL